MANLTTQNYKGARDFYPEDMRTQRHIFSAWQRVAERFGYEEYTAPLLEYTDLYRAKTGEEIVNEQTYSFTDRGGRDVTIRPEMTPSLARMIAARQQELSYPLRWYSIPNLWRYERPQRGRLREHWQLNVDLFGIADTSAELEIVTLAHALMQELGARDEMFIIRLNHRALMSLFLGEYLGLGVDAAHRLGKLMDRKKKMMLEAFTSQAEAILGDKMGKFETVLKATQLRDLPAELSDSQPAHELALLAKQLQDRGISNIVFDLTLQRGFDYYTGVVFEVFDTNSENARALFGGGRYDDLLQIFKAKPVPAVGFGMGDVTAADFLRTHNLIPELASTTKVSILSLGDEFNEKANQLADSLRVAGINAALDTTNRKASVKIKSADKTSIPFVVFVGAEEIKSGQFSLKELSSGDEQELDAQGLIARLS